MGDSGLTLLINPQWQAGNLVSHLLCDNNTEDPDAHSLQGNQNAFMSGVNSTSSAGV